MGDEISIHKAFFVCHFKIALPSFYGIPTDASIIFSTFRATNYRACLLVNICVATEGNILLYQ